MTIEKAIERGVNKFKFMRGKFSDWGPVMYDKSREILICGACGSHGRILINQYPCPNHEFTAAHKNCKGIQK